MRKLCFCLVLFLSACAGHQIKTPFLWLQNKVIKTNEEIQERGYWEETKYAFETTFEEKEIRECFKDLQRGQPEVIYRDVDDNFYTRSQDVIYFNKKRSLYENLVHEYTHAIIENPSGIKYAPMGDRADLMCLRESLAQAMLKIYRQKEMIETYKARFR